MAIALVGGTQHAQNTTLSSNTCAKAYPGNVTSSNLLIAQVWSQTASTISVADSIGFTWTARPLVTVGGGFFIQQFIAPNIGSSGACTVTATVTGAAAISLLITEWSGAQSGTSFDSGNLSSDALSSGLSTSPLSLSVTPSIANCLVIGCEFNVAGGAATAGAGYTLLDNAGTTSVANVYQIQTTPTATQAAFSITSSSWAATALIIQPFVAATSWGAQLSDQLNRIVQGN